MLHDNTHESPRGSESERNKVREQKKDNTDLNSSRWDDVGVGRLVSQLFVEAEMQRLAPFCEADPTDSHASRRCKTETLGR